MPLFKRICRIAIQTEDNTFLEFDEKFRITFSITKNDTSTPSNANVSIYNLSKATRDKLNQAIKINAQRFNQKLPPFKMVVYAGYEEYKGLQLLFSGDFIQSISEFKSPDLITTISSASGFFGMGTLSDPATLLSLSYKAGIDSNSVIKQIVEQMKSNISSISDWADTNFVFSKGMSLSGRARDMLDKIAGALNLTWFIENNKVVLVKKKGGATKQEELLISPETGLLDIPQQSGDSGGGLLTIGQNAPETGWNIKTLLLPDAIPRRKIKVESETVTGTFIINTVAHAGDTWSGDWATTINTLVQSL